MQFRFFAGGYVLHFFLHVSPSLSVHAGGLGGGDVGSGDGGGEQAPETHPEP